MMEQAAAADEATEGRLGMLGSQGAVLPAALVEVAKSAQAVRQAGSF